MKSWSAMLVCLLAVGFQSPAVGDVPPQRDLYGDPLPAGALVRLGTARFRGGDARMAPGFIAGGETFVTLAGSDDMAIVEISSGRRICEVDLAGQRVITGCLMPNRQSLLTLGNEFDEESGQGFQSIREWNLATGEQTRSFQLEGRVVCERLSVTRDGLHLVTAGSDGAVRVWDAGTAEEVAKITFAQHRIDSLALAPDSRLLAISAGKRVHLWKWADGDAAESFDCGSTVSSLAFSPDGLLLAEGPELGTRVTLRDVLGGDIVRALTTGTDQPMFVNELVFTPDGLSVIAANGIGIRGLQNRIHAWDVGTGRLDQQFETEGFEPYRIAVSGDGHWLAASGPRSTVVQVWDLHTGKGLGQEHPTHRGPINAILFSRDGRQVFTASDDGTIRIWAAGTGRQQRMLEPAARVCALSLSTDERWLVSSSLNNAVQIWDVATGRELQKLPGHGDRGGTRAVAFNVDASRCISWGDDIRLCIWNLITRTPVTECRVHPPEMKLPEIQNAAESVRDIGSLRFAIDQAVFSADGKRLLLGCPSSISLFDTESGQCLRSLDHPDGALVSLAVSPDGSRFLTSAWGKPVDTIMPDGRVRTSANKHQTFRVRDLATGATLLEVPFPDGGAGPAEFSSDGRSVAVAGRGRHGGLRLFDVTTGQMTVNLGAIPPGARVLRFSADGCRLACGFDDGTVLIWQIREPFTAEEILDQNVDGYVTVEIPAGKVQVVNIDSVFQPGVSHAHLVYARVEQPAARRQFCIVISREVATRLLQLGIDDLVAHLQGKSLRVVGTVHKHEASEENPVTLFKLGVTQLEQIERILGEPKRPE